MHNNRYYTEHLTLPIVNGPNEGITGVITLYVVTGLIGISKLPNRRTNLLGNQVWTEKIGSFSVNTIALCLFTLMALSNILIKYILLKHSNKKH